MAATTQFHVHFLNEPPDGRQIVWLFGN